MAILLTNDDGIDAPGLAALAQGLAGLDALHVSAPDRNMSGVGMGITISRDLKATRHPDGAAGEARHSLDGTPADAAKYGIQKILADDPPRLVVSGINYGPNLGVNIRCSGTLGAAFEAVSSGLNALAVSVEYVENPNWEGAKFYARKMAEMLLALPPGGEPFVLNLNVPSRNPEDIRGLVTARNGRGGFCDRLHNAGGDTFRLEPDWIRVDDDSDCDSAAFDAGYAVVTPLRFEMTHDTMLDELCRIWNSQVSPFRPGAPD